MPRQTVRTNEREWQGRVLQCLSAYLVQPFERVTQEAGVEGLFPDLVIWVDRMAGLGAAVIELKTPETDVRDAELKAKGLTKALDVKARYVVTWNMRDTVVWLVTDTERLKELWAYDPLPIHHTEDWLNQEASTEERSRQLVLELAEHHLHGSPQRRLPPETTHFIETVFSAVGRLVPLYSGLLPQVNRDELLRWARRQQVQLDDNYQTAARHIVYRLIVQVLFYHALSQFRGDLPALVNLDGTSAVEFQTILRGRFRNVREIDYEAIFEERFVDTISFSAAIARELQTFCVALNRLNLTRLSVDVVGHLFEAIIPEESKKQLGQYFTEDRVADLLVSFACRDPRDNVFDPTCGTGGILLRAYAYLRYLAPQKSHSDIIAQLWGNDISDFPVELAAVNLYRQDPASTEVFPRVLAGDIFNLEPGAAVSLTPAKRLAGGVAVAVTLPVFDAVVGNPPYVRRQTIGSWTTDPEGYRHRLWTTFPELESHYSDLYAFVFLHALRFLRPGGRLAFITSNSWLESEYGLSLQRAFLQHFKLLAIVESRCEAWFDKARVNTVITVLERVTPGEALGASLGDARHSLSTHLVKFVRFKRPLSELLPGVASEPARFDRYLELRQVIEETQEECENRDILVRPVPQAALLRSIAPDARINKWGHFLRAPRAFEDIVDAQRGILAPLGDVLDVNFGTLTGWNDFYCPKQGTAGFSTFAEVEQQFRLPILGSIRDLDDFVVQREHCSEIFVCNDPKTSLRGTNALAHIRWGERQLNDHDEPFFRTGEMAMRVPWYTTRPLVRGDVVFQMFIANRHFAAYNPNEFAVTNNALAGRFKDRALVEVGAAILNSLWFFLVCELWGRINLGEGALKIEKIDLEVMPVPAPDLLLRGPHGEVMVQSFRRMRERKPLALWDEVNQGDREMLDEALFDFFGLDGPSRSALRDSLVRLVREREMVAEMRKHQVAKRIERDNDVVVAEVVAEVLPGGTRPFPEEFCDKSWRTRQVDVPAAGLVVVAAPRIRDQEDLFSGAPVFELAGDDEYTGTVETSAEAEFIYYSQNGVRRTVRMPAQPERVHAAVAAYRTYVERVEEELVHAFFSRTPSYARARALARGVLVREGIAYVGLRYKGRDIGS
jgi:SAM-dependent methyltransferase